MKKTKSKKHATFTGTQVGTILEDIQSQFMAFGEGQQILSDNVDKLDKKADKLDSKVDRLDIRLNNVENKVDKLDTRLNNVESNLKTINSRLTRIEDDVVEIKHKLSEKVDMADFKKLEKRMVGLEKLVFAKMT